MPIIDPPVNTSSSTAACQGSSLFLPDGTEIFRDTSIVTVFTTPEGCDSSHTANYVFLARVEDFRTDSICPEEDLIIGDQVLSNPGTYRITLPGQQEQCDTVLTISLFPRLPDTISIDTSLEIGEIFELDNIPYSQPGAYTYFRSPRKEDCGTFFFINLDFTSSIRALSDTDFWHANPLRIGKGELRFHDSRGLTIGFDQLRLYSATGQLIELEKSINQEAMGIPSTLLPGIYFYSVQLRLPGNPKWVSGKLVLW